MSGRVIPTERNTAPPAVVVVDSCLLHHSAGLHCPFKPQWWGAVHCAEGLLLSPGVFAGVEEALSSPELGGGGVREYASAPADLLFRTEPSAPAAPIPLLHYPCYSISPNILQNLPFYRPKSYSTQNTSHTCTTQLPTYTPTHRHAGQMPQHHRPPQSPPWHPG